MVVLKPLGLVVARPYGLGHRCWVDCLAVLEGCEELQNAAALGPHCGWEASEQPSADGLDCRQWRLGLGGSDSPGRVSGRRGCGRRWHGCRDRYPPRRMGIHSDGVCRRTVHSGAVKSVAIIHEVRAGGTAKGNRHHRGSTRWLRREVGATACQRIHERMGRDHDSFLGCCTSSRGRGNDRTGGARKNTHGRRGDVRQNHVRANAEPLLVVFEK